MHTTLTHTTLTCIHTTVLQSDPIEICDIILFCTKDVFLVATTPPPCLFLHSCSLPAPHSLPVPPFVLTSSPPLVVCSSIRAHFQHPHSLPILLFMLTSSILTPCLFLYSCSLPAPHSLPVPPFMLTSSPHSLPVPPFMLTSSPPLLACSSIMYVTSEL